MKAEERIKELGITLPETAPPRAMYVPVKRTGNLLYVSGQLPMRQDGTILKGKIGKERSIEHGQEAARLCAISILAALKIELGDLDLIKNFVKLQVFVNCEPDFSEPHIVANGASQLLYDVFGEPGRHARTTIGTVQLPLDTSVEVEAIVEI